MKWNDFSASFWQHNVRRNELLQYNTPEEAFFASNDYRELIWMLFEMLPEQTAQHVLITSLATLFGNECDEFIAEMHACLYGFPNNLDALQNNAWTEKQPPQIYILFYASLPINTYRQNKADAWIYALFPVRFAMLPIIQKTCKELNSFV